MAGKLGGLGKGLDAIFIENDTNDSNSNVFLKISDIEPNRDQPRKEFNEEALRELADSIATHGVLQPLLVRPLAGGGYQLVAGERRWRASRMAGLSEVPVVIREMTDSEMTQIALIENLQREDLNSVEEALGYKSLMDTYNLTQDEVAKAVGKSRPAVANVMRLLNLPEEIQDMLKDGEISAGHARALLGIADKETMIKIAKSIVPQDLTVRDVERLAKKQNTDKKPKSEKQYLKRAPIYDEVELSLNEHLSRRVKVMNDKENNGTLEIEFYSEDDLIQLAKLLGGEE
ncbi:MAG: ParB/RepB/Spo0J family partition protein [Candidatus Pseudoruminococcus sp.]|uniref:ParB/RepB/Spo0J family partition protein n=1 Tax=Candidatus Pseudoruminococcus sp. TaxID=3101048 RepID=UPI002A7D3ACE|nr:ParB/RepB/Spo0J family partition protein [Ruminococcus sp.]MDY2782510.1 ParB/RepB/Spo0J family partition protein [Candidatus Pseudoruminococcus sp.]